MAVARVLLAAPKGAAGQGHDCWHSHSRGPECTERGRGHMAKPSPVAKHKRRLLETCQYRSEKLLKVNYSLFFFLFFFGTVRFFSKVNSTVPYGPALDESLVLYV